MRTGLRQALAVAGVTLLLAGACSDDKGSSTTSAAGAPSSSSAPVTTTTLVASTTTARPTTQPAAPLVAEAGGWRLAISAPTTGATIGSAVDLCYELTGPTQATVAFEVTLVLNATGTVISRSSVDAAVGRGTARVNVGTPEQRRYDLNVQGIVNGQPLSGLTVRIGGVVLGAATPAGCA